MNAQQAKIKASGGNLALVEAYRLEAQALRAQADAKEAQAAALEAQAASPSGALLSVEQALEQYGAGRGALLAASARGELTLLRGARRRTMVDRAELERWIRSRPVQPRRPRKAAPASDLDAWDQQAIRALGAVKGARR